MFSFSVECQMKECLCTVQVRFTVFFPEGGVGLVPKRGCLLFTLAYYDGGMILTGKNRRTLRKTCPSATLSTTNLTCIDPGANPGLRGEKPATNDLSHGMALSWQFLEGISLSRQPRKLRRINWVWIVFKEILSTGSNWYKCRPFSCLCSIRDPLSGSYVWRYVTRKPLQSAGESSRWMTLHLPTDVLSRGVPNRRRPLFHAGILRISAFLIRILEFPGSSAVLWTRCRGYSRHLSLYITFSAGVI
jgi:hypothetical protein